MKIAIIGAGFCGLATAWHIFQKNPHIKITLFDEKPIGKGTSGIAAGLLHPFAGAHSKYNWKGHEGMEATKELLAVSSSSLGKPITAKSRGILRLALNEEQVLDFRLCAEKYPTETEWLDSAQELAPGCVQAPALWIKEGLSVYSALYLEGLYKACEKAQFEQRKIHSLKELDHFDAVIVTAGGKSLQIEELSNIPIKLTKGQLLELEWPNIPPLNFTLNSHVYLLMTPGNRSCLTGATFEKNFANDDIDLETAKNELLPKVAELFPPLKNAKILNSFAGLRAVTPNHLPMIQEISPSSWLLTGMGSKGLLYHALFARELAERI